jgi:hypothetical protein
VTPRLKWFAAVVLGLLLGLFMTGAGYQIQWHQMQDTMQRQSMSPLLDPRTNAKIAICVPVISLAFRLGSPSLPVFVLLVAGNIIFWAGLVLLIARVFLRPRAKGGIHEPAA